MDKWSLLNPGSNSARVDGVARVAYRWRMARSEGENELGPANQTEPMETDKYVKCAELTPTTAAVIALCRLERGKDRA